MTVHWIGLDMPIAFKQIFKWFLNLSYTVMHRETALSNS